LNGRGGVAKQGINQPGKLTQDSPGFGGIWGILVVGKFINCFFKKLIIII
jgi:hypothetical protein